MTPAPRRRRAPTRRSRELTALDVVVILVVLAVVAGLVAWIITNAGGGHFLV